MSPPQAYIAGQGEADSRSQGTWDPHPQHPRLPRGSRIRNKEHLVWMRPSSARRAAHTRTRPSEWEAKTTLHQMVGERGGGRRHARHSGGQRSHVTRNLSTVAQKRLTCPAASGPEVATPAATAARQAKLYPHTPFTTHMRAFCPRIANCLICRPTHPHKQPLPLPPISPLAPRSLALLPSRDTRRLAHLKIVLHVRPHSTLRRTRRDGDDKEKRKRNQWRKREIFRLQLYVVDVVVLSDPSCNSASASPLSNPLLILSVHP
ncbi:hypothetical protein BKA80DRAFT_61920 [Phyllosticta citrichinensis]